jgi:hypothetical protein
LGYAFGNSMGYAFGNSFGNLLEEGKKFAQGSI